MHRSSGKNAQLLGFCGMTSVTKLKSKLPDTVVIKLVPWYTPMAAEKSKSVWLVFAELQSR